jgi:hypothetical protein
METRIAKCCFIPCDKDADFEIRENTRTDPDNYTHSCEDHVGKMLGTTAGFSECLDWTVSFIGERVGEGAPSAVPVV